MNNPTRKSWVTIDFLIIVSFLENMEDDKERDCRLVWNHDLLFPCVWMEEEGLGVLSVVDESFSARRNRN